MVCGRSLCSGATSLRHAARALLVCAGVARARAQAPTLLGVSWEPAIWSPPSSCPFPPGDAVFSCSAPSVRLLLVGRGFGSAVGSVGLTANTTFPLAAPAPPPVDLPDALSADSLTNGAPDGCWVPSVYAADDAAFSVCPYGAALLRGPPAAGANVVASLGAFADVARSVGPPSAGNCSAVTGLIFRGGGLCGGLTPRSANVTFVCLDANDPEAPFFIANPGVWFADSPDGGCSWALDVPLLAACDGPNYGLCATEPAPPPPPAPSAPPAFPSAGAAFVPPAPGAWADTVVVAYAMGSAPPAAVVLTLPGTLLSSSAVAPEPAPLRPSRSPIPVPFPSALSIFSISPAWGPASGGTLVTLSLAGVSLADYAAPSGRSFAGFDVLWPTQPGGNLTQAARALGAPESVDGRPPALPLNGLQNITLIAPAAPAGWPAAGGPPLPLAVASRAFDPLVGAWVVNRAAACAVPNGGCAFTYSDVAPSPSPAPSGGGGGGGAAAGGLLSPAATIGVSAGGAVAGVLVLAGAGVACRRRRAAAAAGGGGGGGGAAPPPPRGGAWEVVVKPGAAAGAT